MKIRAALLAAFSLSLLPHVLAIEDPETEVRDVPDPVEKEYDMDDLEEKPGEEPVEINVDRPDFKPTVIQAPFLEQFTDDWNTRWQASNAKKDTKAGEDEWKYVGTWAVEEPTVFRGINGDKGLVVKDEAAHHAISAKFPKPIDPKGKPLVVQYEVKLQNGLECGGAYMKLLQNNKALHAEEFSNSSPYIIMFGPDKCGSTNKVHFIFRHKNPKTGEYEEKHMNEEVNISTDKTTSLYTLIVKPDNKFEVRINGKQEASGSLLSDFTPPVNPPKEIDDPDDKKPDDWVDTQKISDPEAKKPDDWDEDAPYEILDEEATKPDDWLEDEPEMIPDPDAKKPDDWDDEEDGDWVPPQISNPKCYQVSGCGPWTKPNKKNPDYKGKWVAPLIDNPEYKGAWKPRKIANKNFFEDNNPANLEPMGGVGFELWTMQANILFDNVYIGHSIEDAEALQKETFDVKLAIEKKIEDGMRPKESSKKRSKLKRESSGNFWENPVSYVRQQLEEFIPLFKADPKSAVMDMPEVAGGIGVVLVTLIALVVGSLGLGASSPVVQEQAKKAKDKAAEAKDKVADGVTTGAEKVQSEVNKRTTRSSNSDS